MAVIWIKQSLKKRNEKTLEQHTTKEEIAEIQDALLEIAEIISAMGGTEQSDEKGAGEDG
ncbi:MAG: hypothetical protein K2N56_11970 [Oscillospiraceae bacterium]|nr:hypothetical protein [Oscillospiraceae bacterium]